MGMIYLFAVLACVVLLAICFVFLFSNSGPIVKDSTVNDSPAADDGLNVYRQVVSTGVDMSRPRELIVFGLFRDRDSAQRWVDAMRPHGFEPQDFPETFEDPEGEYVDVARVMVIAPDSLVELLAAARAAAADAGGEFDGHEIEASP